MNIENNKLFGGVFMAGNGNSGRNPTFHLSEKELSQKITKYKMDLEEGKFARASWPHFAAYLDSTEAELAEVMKQGESKGSAYWGRGVLNFENDIEISSNTCKDGITALHKK